MIISALTKFAEIGKSKKDSSCYLVEREDDDRPGDGDGICTQSEKIKGGCQEAFGDGVGNDNGICEEVREISNGNGKKVKTWEACEEICIVSEEDTADDCSQLETMDGLLEDTNDELATLNAQTSAELQKLGQQQEIAGQIANDVVQQEVNVCNDVRTVAITPSLEYPSFGYTGGGRSADWNSSVYFYQSPRQG